MLSLQLSPPASEAKEPASAPVWKLLVYDHVGMAIIAPLLSLNDLRSYGVTLHMFVPSPALFCSFSLHTVRVDRLIDQRREPVHDVALYFVAPTEANISLIAKVISFVFAFIICFVCSSVFCSFPAHPPHSQSLLYYRTVELACMTAFTWRSRPVSLPRF